MKTMLLECLAALSMLLAGFQGTQGSVPVPPETPVLLEEEATMEKLTIQIGEQSFSALLYDNETARALEERLPMTLDMEELHGNEKYYYMDEGLPTQSSCPEAIHAGELMLYGSDCLVLFYESFPTIYSYTPLGYVENPDGLAEALGSGGVTVRFSKQD